MKLNGNVAQKATGCIARIGAIVFAGFWLGTLGTMFSSFLAPELYREIRKPLCYKPVEGVVTKYTPPSEKTDDFGETTFEAGLIEYRYVVSEATFTGKYRQPGKGARLNEFSRRLVGRQHAGRKLQVWYDPDEPKSSTLEPVAQPQLLGFVIFLMPFLAIGVGMMVFGLTGKGLPARPGVGTRGRAQLALRGGAGVYFPAYMILSAVCAFGYFALSFVLDWKTAWFVGAALLAVVVPGLTLLIGRAISARWRRKTPTAQQEPAAGVRQQPPGEPVFPEAAAIRATPQPARGQPPAAAPSPAEFPSLRRKLRVLVFMMLLWNGLTGVFTGYVIWSIVKHHEAETRFAPTPGEVLASKVEVQPGDSDSGPTYRPLIKYRYTVAGREYTSTRYSYGTPGSSNRAWADRIVRDHPKGRKVTVYYDPDDPAEAVLHRQVPPLNWFLLLFLQPFLLVGLGLLVATVALPIRHARARRFVEDAAPLPASIPGWAPLQEDVGGYTLAPRRSVLPVVFGLATGYGLTCFVSIFLVAFLGEPESTPPRTLGIVFGIAGGVGLGGAVSALLRSAGKAVLFIDPRLKQISLTSPKRDVRLKFADLDHWLVRTIRDTGQQSGSRRPSARPLLAVSGRDGTEHPVRVFAASDAAGHVARKAGRILARLTESTFRESAEQAPAPQMPEGPDEAIGTSRSAADEQRRLRRDYSDLM